MLGFDRVYDYEPGKVDWLAHNLPTEGDRPAPPTVGRVMRDDVTRCGPAERAADVLAAIERSPYPFALVATPGSVVLGRIPASKLNADSVQPVGDIAEPGPKTFRPHHSAENVARQLAKKELRWAIVTTPEGRLLGVASREDLERAAKSR
jgi:CBS domain-containing protein